MHDPRQSFSAPQCLHHGIPHSTPFKAGAQVQRFHMLLFWLLGMLAPCVGRHIVGTEVPRLKDMCRTKYLSDWSAACVLGLLTGLTILILQRYMSADAVHQLLTFNPADFFT